MHYNLKTDLHIGVVARFSKAKNVEKIKNPLNFLFLTSLINIWSLKATKNDGEGHIIESKAKFMNGSFAFRLG